MVPGRHIDLRNLRFGYWRDSLPEQGDTMGQISRFPGSQVAASLHLGDVSDVLEHGSQVDASRMPVERAVSHEIDVACAYSYLAGTTRPSSTC